jgi:hypothetical protein
MARLTNLGVLLGAASLLFAANALAGGFSQPSSPPSGDDVVLCCQSATLPESPPSTTDFTGVFLFKGCKGIDPGADAFNSCNDGLFVNCAETPAACVNSSSGVSSSGKGGRKDCICGVNLNISLLINLNLSN